MLICKHCGSIFDEPQTSYTAGGDTGEPWAVCPNCHSDELDEAARCEACGEWLSTADMVDTGLCKVCYNDGLTLHTMEGFVVAAGLQDDFYLCYLADLYHEQILQVAQKWFDSLPSDEREGRLKDYAEAEDGFCDYLREELR